MQMMIKHIIQDSELYNAIANWHNCIQINIKTLGHKKTEWFETMTRQIEYKQVSDVKTIQMWSIGGPVNVGMML